MDKVLDRRRPDSVDQLMPWNGNPQAECFDQYVEGVP